jgi:hypothetical protein
VATRCSRHSIVSSRPSWSTTTTRTRGIFTAASRT